MMFSRFAVLLLLGVAAVFPAPSLGGEDGDTRSRFLAGQFLVAAPNMGDPRFRDTVVYMVNHDSSGAMGLVINRPFGSGPMRSLMKGFGIDGEGLENVEQTVQLYYGGPVDSGRILILHSADYQGTDTTAVSDEVSVSTHVDILKAIARGKGPEHSLFVLGYAGWSPGQLEGEMARESWTTAPAELGLIFGDDPKTLWNRVVKKSGVEL